MGEIAAVARFWAHAGITPPAETADEKRKGGERALQAIDRHLADTPFLVADRYTIADIALYAYTHVAHQCDYDLTAFPAIRAWLGRVAAQPGHVTMEHKPAAVAPAL